MNKKWLLGGVLSLTILFLIGCYFVFFAPTRFGVVLEVQNVQFSPKELNFTLTFLETKDEGLTLFRIEVSSYCFEAYYTTFYVGDKAHINIPHNGSITNLPVACSLWISVITPYQGTEIVTINVEEGKQYAF